MIVFAAFCVGAASGVAVKRLWERVTRDDGAEGARLIAAAAAAGKRVKRSASRFVEDLEDIVAEARAEADEVSPPPGANGAAANGAAGGVAGAEAAPASDPAPRGIGQA